METCGECTISALSSVYVVFVGMIWPDELRVLERFEVTISPPLEVGKAESNIAVTLLEDRNIKTQRW